jgi:nucleotide-binding universal stress UspA family protein
LLASPHQAGLLTYPASSTEDDMPARITRDIIQDTEHTDVGLKVVVVATDFSHDGDQAVWRASDLALSSDATLVLTHVLPRHFEASVDSLIRSAAERALDQTASTIGDRLVAAGRSDVKVKVRLVRGVPAEEIEKIAETNEADLVTIGRRGHNPLRELLIGSTASKLLRLGRFPVLVGGGSGRTTYENVLLGYDLSEPAQAAARLLKRMLGEGVVPTVVHAFEHQWLGLPPVYLINTSDEDSRVPFESLDARRQEVLQALAGLWSPEDLRIVVEASDPRSLLLETARRTNADLIVMGSRGLSGFARVALGSVAGSVLHRAEMDVLIVPGDSEESKIA